jgi:CheY-like chemotaxis protein
MTKNSRILVVEDNDFVRMQIVTFLKSAEYDVVEARDGEEALVKVQDSISLAVADVRMEPVGGFEFVRGVRAMGLDLPVILVTGDQDPDLLSGSSKLGVAALLMKPVQKDRLIKTVERTLVMAGRRG